MKKGILHLIQPTLLPAPWQELLLALPRVLGGLMLCFEFGSSKFGMPWSTTEEMGLFEVAAWFPEDVAKFGFPYALAPLAFAWLGAAVEAIGGLFLVFGLGTRFWGVLLSITMLTAVFEQKWTQVIEYGSSWPILPALGFLWIAIYAMVMGSGRIGLDYWITQRASR